jgi:hypothetical protein
MLIRFIRFFKIHPDKADLIVVNTLKLVYAPLVMESL